MKKFLVWCVLLSVILTTFSSCKEDEPEPIPIIVGEWTRDIYQLVDLPAGFTLYEGYVFGSLYAGEESYTINVMADLTYSRKIQRVGPDRNDTGVWTLEGDDLKLDSNDSDIDDDEFTVEEEITTHEMIISQVITFNLLPDAVTDTLTSEWANAHPDELDTYLKPVDVTVLFLFEK